MLVLNWIDKRTEGRWCLLTFNLVFLRVFCKHIRKCLYGVFLKRVWHEISPQSTGSFSEFILLILSPLQKKNFCHASPCLTPILHPHFYNFLTSSPCLEVSIHPIYTLQKWLRSDSDTPERSQVYNRPDVYRHSHQSHKWKFPLI